jgi:hypothetical protein
VEHRSTNLVAVAPDRTREGGVEEEAGGRRAEGRMLPRTTGAIVITVAASGASERVKDRGRKGRKP